MRRRAAPLVAAAAAAALGCAGLSLEELPPDPIAFVHRTTDEAKERAELLDPRARPRPTPGRSVVRMQAVENFVGHLGGETEEDRLAETIGRLALFHPHTGEVEPLAVARSGARPLDWTPDRKRLLFAEPRGRFPRVFSFDVASGEVAPVGSGREAQPWASMGPDGRVAYSRIVGSKKPRSRIWLLDRDGKRRPLSEGPADYRPRFSPDGSAILYSSYLPSGSPAIYRVEPEGDAPPRLVARGVDPDFAPDGSWVAYSQRLKGRWQLWRMNPDGTGKYAIGGAPSAVQKLDNVHPAVSPDGRFIVYVSEEFGRQELRVRRSDGSGDRPLLEGADGADPVW